MKFNRREWEARCRAAWEPLSPRPDGTWEAGGAGIVTELLGRARGLGWIPPGPGPARAEFAAAGPGGELVMGLGGMDEATAREFTHGWAVAVQMAREAGRWTP